MIDSGIETWQPSDYCLGVSADSPAAVLTETVYERLCRHDFTAPGFCLLNLGRETSSQSLRSYIIALKRALQVVHQGRAGRDLVFLSAARFDQQETTKLHRDGGPEESFLMLGYEPSPVSSEVVLCDVSRCAFEMGLTPGEVLQRHNPMFGPGAAVLEPYNTRVACFSNEQAQILLINNSIAPYSPKHLAWQGVLHTATILDPNDKHRRVVNSTMIASVPLGAEEPVSLDAQNEFIYNSVVRRRGYDKPHLDDE